MAQRQESELVNGCRSFPTQQNKLRSQRNSFCFNKVNHLELSVNTIFLRQTFVKINTSAIVCP